MPIPGIPQPAFIEINPRLRLHTIQSPYDFALPWYQDAETLLLVDGKPDPYDLVRLERMYAYLDAHGELYFIEQLVGSIFQPIGDVTFSQEDMPIVIGDKSLRGCGIGEEVIRTLITRGKQLALQELRIEEIYHCNKGSRRLFTKCGFHPYEETERGSRFRLILQPVKIEQ